MQSHLMLVKTRKYYYSKLCCNKYSTNTIQLNELNEYFNNYLDSIPIKTTSHGLTHRRVLLIITLFLIIPC